MKDLVYNRLLPSTNQRVRALSSSAEVVGPITAHPKALVEPKVRKERIPKWRAGKEIPQVALTADGRWPADAYSQSLCTNATGSLLADGSLYKRYEAGGTYFCLKMKGASKEYLQSRAAAWGKLGYSTPRVPVVTKLSERSKVTGEPLQAIYYRTITTRALN